MLGTPFADTLLGDDGSNRLFGSAGNDVLNGRGGTDRVNGGPGADTMTGGGAADRFVYGSVLDGPTGAVRDVITDFVHGTDKIDLAAIDAKDTLGFVGDQAFTFRGTSALTGIGQVKFAYLAGPNDTVISANTAGDTTPEMQIVLDGKIALTASDFIL